jgi:hypothetical protein
MTSMISASPRLATIAIIFSVIVAAGIVYGLFGERMGLRTVYHAPASPSATK